VANNQTVQGEGGAPNQPSPNSGSHPMLGVVNAMGRRFQNSSFSHPMIVAAHTQGNSLISKVTNGGPMKTGSGITIGINKPASPDANPDGINKPAAQIGVVVVLHLVYLVREELDQLHQLLVVLS